MINEDYKYSAITGKIIGCAMEVHKRLGNGFQACLPKGQYGLQAGSDIPAGFKN